MSKTKVTSKVTKPAKDVLSKVKDTGVSKSKDSKSKIAVEKEEKKSKKSKKDKKKVKEPTPEPESSSEEEDDSAESSSSESDSEVDTKKPVVNGKKASSTDTSTVANGVKAKKDDSSDESDADSDSSESDAEVPAPKEAAAKVNGTKVSAKKDESDDSEADASSDESESSADEADTKPKVNGTKAAASSDEEEDSDDEASDSSDSESEEEEKEKPAKVNKRKAEAEVEPVTKKAKTESAPAEDGEERKNLFVGNLSWNVDDAYLREAFEEFGELSGVRVMMDRATGRAKGFGYVEFVNAADAAKAYAAKKDTELDGRTMNLDYAAKKPDSGERQDNRRKSYGDQLSEPTANVFVGNLAWDVGQEQVSETFAPYGTILSVRLPTDQETGAPKGFGYVEFSSVEEAQAAVEAMQGGYISSRPVRLDFSQPRPPREGGRGGGRGGFGGRGRGGDRGGRGGRGGFGGGFSGGRGRGAPRGRGHTTNRGGFGDFKGQKVSFD